MGLYTEFPEYLSENNSFVIEDLIEESFSYTGSSKLDVNSFVTHFSLVLEKNIRELVSLELLKSIVDTNIDRILSYLSDKDERLIVFLPIQKLEAEFRESVPKLGGELSEAVNTFPTCTRDQELTIQAAVLNNQPATVNCLPETTKEEILSKNNLGALTDFNTLINNLENKDEVLSLNENEELAVVLSAFRVQSESRRNILQGSTTVKDIYSSSEIIIFYLTMATILTTLFFLVINRSNLRKSSRNLSAGIIIQTLFGVILVWIIKALFISIPEESLNIDNNRFQDNFVIILRELINDLTTPFLNLSYLIIIICLAIVIFDIYLKKRAEKSEEIMNKPSL